MGMPGYTTVAQWAEFRLEEKKSVFIGEACPVANEQQALQFLEQVRRKYPDAKHHVYAYLLREDAKNRYSDDHEPQGSAGMPVLDCIRKGGYTDTAVVVTRYFGGVLLGVGGLVRAYTAAAAGALQAAGKNIYREKVQLTLRLSYADYNRVLALLGQDEGWIYDTAFEADVCLSLAVPTEQSDLLVVQLTEETCGRAVIEVGETVFSADQK